MHCKLFLVAAICIGFAQAAVADEYRFVHENTLGTTLELEITASSEEDARAAEAATLAEIDRLDGVLSGYRDDSEFVRFSDADVNETAPVSSDLHALLAAAEHFRKLTGGRFDLRAHQIRTKWLQSLKAGATPSEESLTALKKQFAEAPYRINPSDLHVVRLQDTTMSVDGLAKGYILDAVCELVNERFPQLSHFMINIGGDICHAGLGSIDVGIADPANAAEQASPVERVRLNEGSAVATSGNYRRFQTVGDFQLGHLFDPVSCMPATDIASATVIAPDAMTADAFATTISVMRPQEAIAWINQQPGCSCFIIESNGTQSRSSRWPSSSSAAPRMYFTQAEATESSGQSTEVPGLHVWFKLDRPNGRRYRRPYVAIWLEDADDYPVKTALLWMQTDQPGPRWHRDLTRWYRNDRLRKIVEQSDMIGTVSGATRGPGEYEAHFDGTDNEGKPLPPGKYTLLLEAAREHGTYQLIRQTIEWGGEAVGRKALTGNIEIPQASYEYVPNK